MSDADHPPQVDPDELLRTKLSPPRLSSTLVPRAVLLKRLDQGRATPLALVSAPAGYGKTTLVAQWLATLDGPSAWVSLDAGDNDPVRFWRYVITACQAFQSTLGQAALGTMRTSRQPSFDALLTSLMNELAALRESGVLVLEDYNVITSPRVHSTMAFFVEHLPATLHLVLLARGEPPLPLARLRAHNQLSEIKPADLRFSPAETQAFLSNLRVALAPDALARLQARTEGWAAGLRLAALALEGQRDPATVDKLIDTFAGEQRHILDYLVGEVLAGQADAAQQFLLETSFLERLTGSLCDAVTGRADGAATLADLERANLFLVPLTEKDASVHAGRPLPWYRYHMLFAQAMRQFAQQRLGETRIRELHARVSVWYERHGFPDDAIEAALAAQAYGRAAALVEGRIQAHGYSELYTLQRWIQNLPREVVDAHPMLSYADAAAVLFSSDRYAPLTAAQVESRLDVAERGWRQAKNDRGVGQVLALRATVALWQGDHARSYSYAQQALEFLPEDEADWRGVSLLAIGTEELFNGEIDTAERTILQARLLCQAGQNPHSVLAAEQMLARVYTARLELDQAKQIYARVLVDAGEIETMVEDRAAAYIGLGLIAFERNDLAPAEQSAADALGIHSPRVDDEIKMQASVLLARVYQARGESAQGQALLRTYAARIRHPALLRELLAWQARLALTAGDVAAAQHWQATYATSADPVIPAQQEREALILARLQIAQGQPRAVLELLDHWQADAQRNGRISSELDILCIQALAYQSQADKKRARQTLERALTLAQAKNCRRVLIDEGEPMKMLLQAVIPDIDERPLALFAASLLRSFVAVRPGEPAAAPTTSLLEPLSTQEQRVLRLLAAGLSNPEIARELVVSTNTIKTQVQSIFRKLNVNSRAEAKEMARQLNLS